MNYGTIVVLISITWSCYEDTKTPFVVFSLNNKCKISTTYGNQDRFTFG